MTDADNSEVLNHVEALGLTSTEARAYLAVAQLGLCKVQQIARKAELQRTEIYRLMDNLVSKGLIKETVDKPRRYSAVSYKLAIQRFIDQHKQHLQTIVQDSHALVEKLEKIGLLSTWDMRTPTIAILTGRDEIGKHFEECLANAQHEIRIGTGMKNLNFATPYMVKKFVKTVTAKKLRIRTIIDLEYGVPPKIAKLSSVLNIRHFHPIQMHFYSIDDKCAALGLENPKEQNPDAISQLTVSYKPLVRTITQFFDAVWNQAVPVSARNALLGRKEPFQSFPQILWGRDEMYRAVDNMLLQAQSRIAALLTPRGPRRAVVRVWKRMEEARERGVKFQLLCKVLKSNHKALSQLSALADVRNCETSLGFGVYLMDDSQAIIHHIYPDSPSINNSSINVGMHIVQKAAVRELCQAFDKMWENSTYWPAPGQFRKSSGIAV